MFPRDPGQDIHSEDDQEIVDKQKEVFAGLIPL